MSTVSYTPFLIARYASGLDNSVQPWLLPDQAQETLFDGFVYRDVWNKRWGFNDFANGLQGGSTYTESRIVVNLGTSPTISFGTGNGTAGPYTYTALSLPISRGSVTITAGAQSATDNGVGGFITTPPGGSGSINYTTGVISITFNAVVPGATAITIVYDSYPGLPMMMIANYYPTNDVRQLVVADTRNVNIYNPTTNRLEYIPTATSYTGNKFNFFSWVNYPDASNAPRLLFSNSVNAIQQYDGSAIIDYVATLTGVTTLSALLLFHIRDRLILLRTKEDAVIFGQRIRISGTGANSDVFDTTATGAGLIDIPDGSWINGAAFNRDDLIIWTENSTWQLQYTGNDTVPFILNKLDNSRGSGAPFAGITYLNRSTTTSPRGFIISDGYRVERMDNKIPTYSFNNIDQDNFKLCFAGSVDEDRDHYLIHPSPGNTTSDQILVTNYEEDNYSVYRLPLSCMGNFIEQFTTNWNSLLAYPDWNSMAQRYGNWEQFSYEKGLPFALGGGQNGQLWRLNVNLTEDNPVAIRNVTIIDENTLEITTDFNSFSVDDYIYLVGMSGMLEANNKQGAISAITTANYVFQIVIPDTSRFSNYVDGGTASRVIPFESMTKKFNPFTMTAQKVRCGYLYMYVTSSGTGLTVNSDIDGITKSNPAIVTSYSHGFQSNQVVTIFGVSGMTQINSLSSAILVIDDNTFSMSQIDSTGFSTYTSGGVAAGPQECYIDIEVITNDNSNNTILQNASLQPISMPFRINCTPNNQDMGTKKWVKIYINQTARFIQFRLKNEQALSQIEIHAMMPGFGPVGRLI